MTQDSLSFELSRLQSIVDRWQFVPTTYLSDICVDWIDIAVQLVTHATWGHVDELRFQTMESSH